MPKLLIAAALLGGSGSTIFAGAAHAWVDMSPSPPANGVTCTEGAGGAADCDFTSVSRYVDDKSVQLLGGDVQVGDMVEFEATGGYWQFDFNPFGTLTALNRPSGFISYQLTIDPTDPRQFAGVTLSSVTTIGGNYTLTKEFYTDSTFTTLLPGAPSLFNPPSPDPASGMLPLTGTNLYVKDTWCIGTLNPNGTCTVDGASTAQIDNFQNTYSQNIPATPGPLPLLGAGAAFGFSRRLRSRLRSAGLAA